MTVYIDLLFFLNLLVDYFILSLTSRLSGAAAGFLRQLGGAAVGALFSFIIFLPAQSLPVEWLARLAFSAVIILCVYGFGGIRRFLRLLFTFYAVSLLYAGFMLAVWFLCHPAGMAVHNGVVYFSISPIVLLAGAGLAYLVISLGRRLMRRPAAAGQRREIEVRLYGKQVRLTALVDTGHSLTDILSDQPVVVATLSAIKPLLPPETLPAFEGIGQPPGDMAGRYRLIPYSVVGGGGLLPAFRCDGACVLPALPGGKRPGAIPTTLRWTEGNRAAEPSLRFPVDRAAGPPVEPAGEPPGAPAVIAVSSQPLGSDYDAIISPELLEREKYGKRSRKKCVSSQNCG
ncbi:MAG: sigma-E processing peptidase SpoIIGA [Clostridiales bacterium]|nr:sigma-E processing peptidase SpoIIGA [Clostridiales bacterium]